MKVHTLPLGQIQTNCYIVEGENGLIIVDPGAEADKIYRKIKLLDKPVLAVILTHAHFDHIGAVDEIAQRYNVPVYLHEKEHSWLQNSEYNGSKKYEMYGVPEVLVNADPVSLQEKDYAFDDIAFEVKHTPGHSPGSMSLIFDDFAIVGDTLFEGSIGRTDLIEGNHNVLMKSIQDVLLELDEDTLIYPGHGNATTIQVEMDHNPFLNGY